MTAANDYDQVGRETAGCDKRETLRFRGIDGDVTLGPNGSTGVVDLLAETSELYFFCGGDRERDACDNPFDAVQATRADNGATTFTFYKKKHGNAPYTRVDTKRDACAKQHSVRVVGKGGDVHVAADSSQLIPLAASTKEITWFCGSGEHAQRSGEVFDHVLCERADNGAIFWTFLVKR